MSTFYNYASKSMEHIAELEKSLSEEDIAWLRAYLSGTDLKPFLKWVSENAEEVEKYLASSESTRRSRKNWNRMPDRILFVYASILGAYYAEDYLQVASALEARIYGKISYREMTAHLGMGIFQECLIRTPLWTLDKNPPKIKITVETET